MRPLKNFMYYENDENDENENENENDEITQNFNVSPLMNNIDVYMNMMLQLKGKDLLSMCLTNPYTYNICQNQHFWKMKLEQEALLYHEYQYLNYKEMYIYLHFIKSIVDIDITDEQSDYLSFRINHRFKLGYYIKLMLFLSIDINTFYDETNKIQKFNSFTMDDKVYVFDIYYKSHEKNYNVAFYLDEYSLNNADSKRQIYTGLSYNQVVNMLFNMYIDGALLKIYNDY